MPFNSLYENQISNEVRSSSDAYSKALYNFHQNLRNGSEYNTSYGASAIETIVPVVESYLIKMVDRRGQHHNKFWWNILRPLISSTASDKKPASTSVADIVALNLVSQLSKKPTLTSVIRKISDAVHNLLDMTFDDREEHLEQTLKFFLGVLQCIEEEADVIVLSNIDNEGYRVVATSQWYGLMDEAMNSLGAYTSVYKPMVCEPIPHTSLFDELSGYLVTRSPLLKKKVRVNGKVHDALTSFTFHNHPEFYAETNKVQATPYTINRKVFEVLRSLYGKGKFFEEFPLSIEQKEATIDEEHQKVVSAQNKLNAYYAQRQGIEFKEVGVKGSNKLRKKVVSKWEEAVRKTNDILSDAEFYAGYDKIWFPVYFDNRGRRFTYVPTGNLTYMGTELAKALLLFADQKALTKQGIRQLFYTLGNALGMDKLPLHIKGIKAVKWWQAHESEFMNGNFDVFVDEQSMFDEPINALAVVMELVSFKKDSSYLSGYIAHRDARCSGASIIGTLLNDEKAMTLTSVLETSQKAVERLPDAYQATADVGYALNVETQQRGAQALTAPFDAQASAPSSLYFEEHKEELFKRSVWKTPTMVYSAYGASRSTIHSGKEGDGGNKKAFEEAGLNIDHLGAFTDLMVSALETTLPSCAAYKDQMKKVSSEFLKANDYWGFINPVTKFPVIRRKTVVVEKELESPGIFQRIRLVLKKTTDELNVRKAVSATSPDTIHAIDSTLLVMVGQKVGDAFPIATIHDSIGSHPNDVPMVVKAYAESMYELATSNVIDSVFEQLGGVAPKKGTLSPDQFEAIKNSKHVLV